MFEDILENTNKFTYNGKKWISEITQAAQEYQSNTSNKAGYGVSREDVIKKMAPQIEHIFREEIISALERCKEFSRLDIYGKHLLSIVSGNAVRIAEPFLKGLGGFAGSRQQMELVAGDIDDFYSGVLFAREVLAEEGESEDGEGEDSGKGKRVLSDKQRAAFWRRFVWPDAGLYESTIETRFEKWNDKAPYWIFLDQGNATYDLAHPKFYGTNFLWAALSRIQAAFDTNLIEEEASLEDRNAKKDDAQLFDDAVADVITRFLENPDYYEPGEILRVYYDNVKKRYYDLYVTKTGRIGKKLHRGSVT